MLVFAVGSFGAKSEGKIFAYFFSCVWHGALLFAFTAETNVVVGAFFLATITGGDDVAIDTIIALLAIAFLEEIATNWHFVLVEDMQVITFVSLLALAFEPVDADDLLMLGLICLEVLTLVKRKKLIERQ